MAGDASSGGVKAPVVKGGAKAEGKGARSKVVEAEESDEEEEMAREAQLLKKLKKGKITKAEFA